MLPFIVAVIFLIGTFGFSTYKYFFDRRLTLFGYASSIFAEFVITIILYEGLQFALSRAG